MTVWRLIELLNQLPDFMKRADVFIQRGNAWVPVTAIYNDPHDEDNGGNPSVGFLYGIGPGDVPILDHPQYDGWGPDVTVRPTDPPPATAARDDGENPL